jgi:hypothetical protein
MPEEVKKYKDQLEGRVMLVKKAKVIPLEAIVRGYLSGGRPNAPVGPLSDPSTLNRFCMVGIQEERDSSQNPNAFWFGGVSEINVSSIHALNEGRDRRARREYLS